MKDDAEDAALVARCVRGETQAFEPLVRRYEGVLFNVAFRMLGSREEARDATQTTFLKAWENRREFDDRHRFFSWIYRILVNHCLNRLAARRRRPDAPLEAEPATPEGTSAALAARELSEHVQAALLQLSEEHREVIVLRHFAELSYGEIAEAAGILEKTVKSRLFEARRRLAQALRERRVEA